MKLDYRANKDKDIQKTFRLKRYKIRLNREKE